MSETSGPVDVGHAVFALHDPNQGRERAFNHWYERDHMYTGGILAPWTIGAARWVATGPLKAARFGSGPFGPLADGSFLTVYWIQRDKLAEQQKWVSEQLTGASRFDEKSVQTATTYDRLAGWRRDDDGPPLFLTLAHGYRGLVWLVLERAADTPIADLSGWLFDDFASEHWTGSPVAAAIAFTPRPKEPWWPPAAPEVDGVGDRVMVACFLDAEPMATWDDQFTPIATEIAGRGTALFAAPFIPTVVGTDRYCDELAP